MQLSLNFINAISSTRRGLFKLGASLLLLAAWLSLASAVWAAPPTIQPGSWTLAILPDTQYYSKSYPNVFYTQTQFLANYKSSLNLAYVLHEGDVTQSNDDAQWKVASKAFETLENAGIGYSILPGNHDYYNNSEDRTSLMADYFPVSRLSAQPTFGGVYRFEPNSPHNSYSLFSAGGIDWLVLAMEFGPRNQIVQWADNVLKRYPNRRAMIVTHSYLYWDNNRLDKNRTDQHGNPHDYGIANEWGGVNDGEEMWQALKDNSNLQFVFCGHIYHQTEDDGWGYRTDLGDGGNVVHQILANYQYYPNRTGYGDGYLRLLEFMADGRTVHVRTYSPWYDKSLTSPEHDFYLTMQVPEPTTGAMLTVGLLVILGAYWSRKRFS
jgi:hypothetical protein